MTRLWPRITPAPTLRTTQLDGARCVGRWWLFDSIDPDDHAEAAKECAICPVRDSCLQVLQEVAAGKRIEGGPVGTWSGRLVGTKPREHGTETGWRQHRSHRDKTCEPCQQAHEKYRDQCAEHAREGAKKRKKSQKVSA